MTKSNLSTRSAHAARNQLAPIDQRLGQIEYRPLVALTAYHNNPRQHPEKQIVKLMDSISEFGFALPALIDSEGVIIAGQARVEAARRLGIGEVPVLVADKWTKTQVRAYRIMDNKLPELASWDHNLLAIELAAIIEIDELGIELLGWETAEIDLLLDGDEVGSAPDPADEIPEMPKVPVSRKGDLWLLEPHRLYCGSSLEVGSWATLMNGTVGTMAFCDLGKAKHAEFAMASGEMSKTEFTGFLTSGIEQMSAHLKDGAVLTLAMDWRHSGEMLAAMEGNGLTILNLCVWNKANGGMGSLYRSKHELFWIARKGYAPHTNNVEPGKRGRHRANVWDYAGVNSFGKTRMADHPTAKPTALVADAIRDVTNPGEIVIDACMGSGTTILAAERTKRIAHGIAIEPGYIDVAIRRWVAMTGKSAVLAETGESFAEVAERRLPELPADADNADAPDTEAA